MTRRTWTPADTATLERLAGYCYDHEIAGITGHCPDTVQRRRSALGLSPYRGTHMRYGTWIELTGGMPDVPSFAAVA